MPTRPDGRPATDPRDLLRRLEGRRVVLEPLGLEHLPGLQAAAADAQVFRWMPEDLSRAGAVGPWLERGLAAAAAGREAPYAVVARPGGAVLGSTRFLELRLEHARVEVGWTWLTREVWGTGVNVEAKLLLLTHAFEAAACRRVEFKTDVRNERSRGALGALGAQFEGILRSHMILPDGTSRDSAYFSVIAPEWPELCGRLRARLEPF